MKRTDPAASLYTYVSSNPSAEQADDSSFFYRSPTSSPTSHHVGRAKAPIHPARCATGGDYPAGRWPLPLRAQIIAHNPSNG